MKVEVPCPHCTFLNAAGRVKCSVCLKYLRKRTRPADDKAGSSSPHPTTQSVSQQPTSRSRVEHSESSAPTTCSPSSALLSEPVSGGVSSGALTPGVVNKTTPTSQKAAKRSTVEETSMANFASADCADASRLATFFSTAAGSPVTVSAKTYKSVQAQLGIAEDENTEEEEEGIRTSPICTPINECGPASKVAAAQRSDKASINDDDTTASLLPASRVGTLFSTAAGNPVTVSVQSCKKAEALLRRGNDDQDGDSSGNSRVLPSEPQNRATLVARPSTRNEEAKSVVSTLFSTASGKTVTVSTASLRSAQAKLHEADKNNCMEDNDDKVSSSIHSKPSPAVVSTLFSTAAGSPVCVSAKSYNSAKAKLHADDDELKSATSEPSSEENTKDIQNGSQHSHRTTTINREKENIVTASTEPTEENEEEESCYRTAPAINNSALSSRRPSTQFKTPFQGSRKPFVPPSRISTAAAAAVGSRTVTPRSTTNIKRIDFDPSEFTSEAVRIPSLQAITAGEFKFFRDNCGAPLQQLLCLDAAPSTTTAVEVSHWRSMLLKLGGSEPHCSPEWCQQMLTSSLIEACGYMSKNSLEVVTATAIASAMCGRYNTEIVEGLRPALRKMVEGDVPAASLMVLYCSAICEERLSPHTRMIRVSDGFYHLKASLDIPLSNLIREGGFVPGSRFSVCGSKLLLGRQCPPTDCLDETIFNFNYNCVRLQGPEAVLGLCQAEPSPQPMELVHPMGGLVPALEGTVTRVLPPFFITPQTATSSTKIVRNFQAQCQHDDRQTRSVLGGGERNGGFGAEPLAGGDDKAAAAEEQQRLSRVSSLILKGSGGEALIQYWEKCAEGCTVKGEDYSMQMPQEGASIVVYALTPSKMHASAPFAHAKVFNSLRSLHFVAKKVPLAHERHIVTSTEDAGKHLQMGAVLDCAGIFLRAEPTDQGTFILLLLKNGNYAIVQVPVASSARVLSFAIPTAKGSPLLVLNATFICHEDPQAGEDCIRLFANEYTVVTQRAAPGGGSVMKEVLSELGASPLRNHIDGQKIASRADEILRCVRAPPSSSIGGGNSGNGSDGNRAVFTRALQQQSYSSNPAPLPELQNGSSAPTDQHRVPYYMRPDFKPTRRDATGVVLPSHPLNSTSSSYSGIQNATSMGVAQPPPRGADRFHYYGNITRIERRGGASQMPWVVFSEGDGSSDAAALQPYCPRGGIPPPPPQPVSFHVTWRYGSAQETRSAEIRLPSVLEDLLEAVIPQQKLFTVVSDERSVDVSLHRAAVLARCGSGGRWWKVLTCSALSPPEGLGEDDDDSYSDGILWLQGEWVTALKILKESLTHCLLKFTLDGSEVKNVFFVADNCPVDNLF